MTSTPSVGQHASVLAALGGRIASGKLAVGQVLTLEDIGSEYAVSRSVAREAIRVLESMGLVASRRRVGITIQPKHRWNVFDPRVIRWRLDEGDRTEQLLSLSELRRGIEPVAAALAAERADANQCRVLAAAVSDMVIHGRAGDLDAYLLADTIFHRTLLEASGNEMLRVPPRRGRRGAQRPHPPRDDAGPPEPDGDRSARRGRPRRPARRRPRRRARDAQHHRGGGHRAAGGTRGTGAGRLTRPARVP